MFVRILTLFISIFGFKFCLAQEILSQKDLTKLPGWAIIQDGRLGNCITCHTIDWPGKFMKEKQGNFAPSLTGVGAKYSREELLQWITDARVFRPNTLMPPYGSQSGIINANPSKPILDHRQINEVVEFLLMLR